MREKEAHLRRPMWFEMTLMEDHMDLYQISMQVVGDASSSEGAEASSAVGAATTTYDMMGLKTDPGGGSRSTSLSKREC
jgi:hypothetical protein